MPRVHQPVHRALKKWTFPVQPLFLAKGEHAFPFSILLEGHLPATRTAALASISYEFSAEARFQEHRPYHQAPEGSRREAQPPAPETPHHSVRVFPHQYQGQRALPAGHLPHRHQYLSMRLDGIAKHNATPNTIEYWKLKKLTWRLEEVAKTIAPACEKHAPKSAEDPEAAPREEGMQRTDSA